jgi:hypothetical protein
MEKDTSDDKLQALMLIQIYCSFYRSIHYVYNNFSLKKLSVDLYKILGSYNNQREKSLKEFDGYNYEKISSDEFDRYKNRITDKLDRFIEEIKSDIPLPRKDKSENDKNPYEIDEIFKEYIEHEIVEKWYNKYDRVCYNFQSKDLQEVLNKVKEVGKYKIKDDAMQEVVDTAALEGIYKFYKKFNSIPDACRYYEGKLGKNVTRAAIKKKIKDKTRIVEDGEELKNWSTINNKINNWVRYENKKPNKTNPIPKGK